MFIINWFFFFRKVSAVTVVCPTCDATVIATGAATSAAVVAAINTYGLYLTYGPPIPGNGVINQLTAINSKLSKSNAFEQEFLSNDKTVVRGVQQDLLMQDAILQTLPSFSTKGCHDVAIARGKQAANSTTKSASSNIKLEIDNKYDGNKHRALFLLI
jgi:hypothetical protein